MQRNYVQCFARGSSEGWEAICLDLDLAVQGTSFEDVQAKLHDTIVTYIEDVVAEGREAQTQLLHRRAPLHVRAKIAASYLLHILRGGDSDDLRGSFDLACPA